MSFIDFARAHGVEINLAKFAPSERVRRCGTTAHPRSTNGAYFWDGRRGWAFAWDGEARVQWFDDPNAKPWTDEEKRAWAQRRQAQQADRERLQQKAAREAAELMRTTVPGPHNYLHRKGLPAAQGLCLPDGGLLVPMRDMVTNELRGAQLIRWTDTEAEPGVMRWVKKMTYGMRAQGAVLRLGQRNAPELVLCEGYATGLSIELAIRQMRFNAAVLVCFSDSNMVHVAERTKGRRYCFADNDKSGAGERAAQATGLPYCMAPTVGWDANDLHKREGLLAVCAPLVKARQEAAAM
ncbi:toprim domain-containing protein [uncultured Xylophilus sp.]|uniref:toprim domain-containing protein n=1 Tax=uncultured Xylophilus sp. TaxID=296832 RepID=UPI0025E0E0B9|nr:toprim domain-containing protein [uncultured Xylophilus sp.]